MLATTTRQRARCAEPHAQPTPADHWLWRNVYNLDAAFFNEHPGQTEYIRPIIQGEFGAHAALIPGPLVRVIHTPEGEMLRAPVYEVRQ